MIFLAEQIREEENLVDDEELNMAVEEIMGIIFKDEAEEE